MQFFRLLYNLFRHLNETQAWNDLIQYVGPGNIYIVLFAIIFAETGLVVTPFLPGDSLLFAVGAVGARHDIQLNLPLVTGLLILAAVLGDAVNYWIGYKIGPAIFRKDDEEWARTAAGEQVGYATPAKQKTLANRLLNRKHLIQAQEFYEKYGAKTIILARFVPVVRTFAPFVAGIGRMNYFRFALYNLIGGVAWVLLCVLAGVFFGRFEIVQKRFELVIIAIVLISVLPMAIEFWKARRAARVELQATATGSDAGRA